jgi:uncharacterized protein
MDIAAHEQPALGDRIISLDALRGFAVMGILAMNIIAFAMPEWAYISPKAYGGDTVADHASWFFSFVFIDGKMRGLFSLLFGASMILIIERAEANGESAAKVHYTRMFWLAIFGLLHYFFIWFGDILFLYAAIGSIAFLCRKWLPNMLIKWALILYGLGCAHFILQLGGLQYLQMMASIPGADPVTIKQFQDIINDPDFNLDSVKELALHRGPYGALVVSRFADWVSPFIGIAQSLPETLPLMMIGMAMKKNGFLAGDWTRAEYARWAERLLIPGLALNALAGISILISGYNLVDTLAAFLAWSSIPRLMVTIGYTALLIIIVQRFAGSCFISRVSAAGQAAFTNYLGTSIVMTTLFYGYGLGLFGYVSRIQLWPFVLGAWAVMLLWPKPWLKRFRYGPLEWLWRSLARGSLQQMRRTLV